MTSANRANHTMAGLLAAVLGAAAAWAGDYPPAEPPKPPTPAPPEGPKEAAPAAPAKDWSASVDSTFNSAYVWRGLRLNDEAVWQPSISATWKGLTVTVWGNVDLTDRRKQARHVSEIDSGADYAWAWDKLKFDLGAVRYDFPHTEFPSTTEAYGSIGVDTLLSPTVKVWRDVALVKGTYGAFILSNTFADVAHLSKTASLSIDCQGSVGYGDRRHNMAYYATNRAAAADATFGLGFPVQIGDHWKIRPSLNFTHLIDSEVSRNVGYRDTFWVGLSTTYSF